MNHNWYLNSTHFLFCYLLQDELKRLYTQLHIYKTKQLKTDNPHLPSKRKGKRNRRFSSAFQKGSRAEVELSTIKTPEESICSNEATMPHSAFNSEDKEPFSFVNVNTLTNSLAVINSSNSSTPSIFSFSNNNNINNNTNVIANASTTQDQNELSNSFLDSNAKLLASAEVQTTPRVQFKSQLTKQSVTSSKLRYCNSLSN